MVLEAPSVFAYVIDQQANPGHLLVSRIVRTMRLGVSVQQTSREAERAFQEHGNS
jgi:hypothetical protein